MKIIMKYLIGLCTGCLVLGGVLGCTAAAPDPGQVGVVVRKPLFFGHGGVGSQAVTTGLSWYAPTTSIWYVMTTPQQFKVHFEDLMSKDGVPLDFDAAIRLRVVDAVSLANNFGLGTLYKINEAEVPIWYYDNVQKPFETAVRQAVRKHGMNETAINTVAIEEIDAEVSSTLKTYIAGIKLPVELIDITVGKANPPDAVKNQRVETATQEQRSNTEKQRKLAEDQRLQAEQARASADNAYREAMRLSPDQFLQLEYIKALHDVCARGGCTFIGSGAGVTPTFNVK